MSKYFKIGTAWDEIKKSKGALETSLSIGKLVSKGVANTAIYATTEMLPKMIKKSQPKMEAKLKDKNISQEERERIEKVMRNQKEALEKINKYNEKK